MNGAITVWVITWRFAWLLVLSGAGLITLGLLSHVRGFANRFPPVRAVAIPLLTPLLLIAWSGAHWATQDAVGTASAVLNGLLVVSAAIAIGWPIVFRKASGFGFVIAASAIGFLYGVAVWFVGSMAIRDSWL